jgi:hypothetical protein
MKNIYLSCTLYNVQYQNTSSLTVHTVVIISQRDGGVILTLLQKLTILWISIDFYFFPPSTSSLGPPNRRTREPSAISIKIVIIY